MDFVFDLRLCFQRENLKLVEDCEIESEKERIRVKISEQRRGDATTLALQTNPLQVKELSWISDCYRLDSKDFSNGFNFNWHLFIKPKPKPDSSDLNSNPISIDWIVLSANDSLRITVQFLHHFHKFDSILIFTSKFNPFHQTLLWISTLLHQISIWKNFSFNLSTIRSYQTCSKLGRSEWKYIGSWIVCDSEWQGRHCEGGYAQKISLDVQSSGELTSSCWIASHPDESTDDKM